MSRMTKFLTGRRLLVGMSLPVMLLLAGCGPKPFNEMSYAEVKEKAAEIAATCEAEGAHYPSKEFDFCMEQEMRKHEHDAYEARRKALVLGAGVAGTANAIGDSYNRQSRMPIP